MKPFDLEAFKTGAPAVNRAGQIVYFGDHDPDCIQADFRLYVQMDIDDPDVGYWVSENGRYYECGLDENDVIGMVDEAEIEQAKHV